MAASQSDIQNNTEITSSPSSNLAKAMILYDYFKLDLDRAIDGNELSTFQAIPPFYTTLIEATTVKNAPRIARMTVTAAEIGTETDLGTETVARAEIPTEAGAVIPPATNHVTTTTNRGK